MRLALLVAVVCVAALAAATLAPTKEGARARLTTPLPLYAAPGTTISVDWTVDVADDDGGRRPFNAIGMFVRLLGRTGGPSTTGFASATGHADGRYAADVAVPQEGIGGLRIGLRGTTDVLFPLANDPFESPGGVRCDVSALRATLDAFVRAYNGGDLQRLDRLFSRERFVWYSSSEPGTRLRAAASTRETLVPYFRTRHRRGDRLKLAAYRFNGYERLRDLGHFALGGKRRADDYAGGRWFTMTGKGALSCSKPPVTIAVMSLGAFPASGRAK